MDGFTIIDAVVIFIVVVSALLAYSRGFVREAMSILGWIAAAILAFLFAAQAEPLIRELPYVGEFLTGSCELSIIAAFAAVFALALVVVSLFTPMFSGVVRRSALGGLDQGIGFLFGALRGIILVAIAFIVYDRVAVEQTLPMVDQSRSASIFAQTQQTIEEQIPTNVPGWITNRYEELVGSCIPGTSSDAAATGADNT